MEILKYLLVLFPAGILAGISSTVAGLASLVSYPALLAVGIPPVFANMTNTTALVFTAFGSGAASRKELRGNGRELLRLLPLTLGGGICGCILLLSAPAASFEHAVPFFIFGAAVLIMRPELSRLFRFLRGRLRGAGGPTAGQAVPVKAAGSEKRALQVLFYLAVFVVGAYTGYFGAAAGVVMLALLTATSSLPFAEYNAIKNVALGASNLVAAVIYIARAHIVWLAALPLAAGFFIGGYIGPHIVRFLPANLLRYTIAAAALLLGVCLLVQAFA